MRHQNTHKYKIHQLGVCVEGWRPIPPISVDKVGIYFRPAVPDAQRSVSSSDIFKYIADRKGSQSTVLTSVYPFKLSICR